MLFNGISHYVIRGQLSKMATKISDVVHINGELGLIWRKEGLIESVF